MGGTEVHYVDGYGGQVLLIAPEFNLIIVTNRSTVWKVIQIAKRLMNSSMNFYRPFWIALSNNVSPNPFFIDVNRFKKSVNFLDSTGYIKPSLFIKHNVS